jgi:hypothetical protein
MIEAVAAPSERLISLCRMFHDLFENALAERGASASA